MHIDAPSVECSQVDFEGLAKPRAITNRNAHGYLQMLISSRAGMDEQDTGEVCWAVEFLCCLTSMPESCIDEKLNQYMCVAIGCIYHCHQQALQASTKEAAC